MIESATNTAIYFPPPFSQVYKYCPKGAHRRNPEEIFITGERTENIVVAKTRIHELVRMTRLFMKDAHVPAAKIDSMLLTRPDKVRKIMENNGTFIQFPALASQRAVIRIQGTEGLHVERTVRDLMLMVSNRELSSSDHTNESSRPYNFTAHHGSSHSRWARRLYNHRHNKSRPC